VYSLAEQIVAGEASATILIVDDEAAILEFVGEALCEEGYSVVLAATLAEALAALVGRRVDLVLADSLLPPPLAYADQQWDALRQILHHAGLAPVVIFTAYQPAFFTDYRKHGFHDLLPKPFDLDQFLTRVRVYLTSVYAEPAATALPSPNIG
jgi:CheY-like chemotaxis protein